MCARVVVGRSLGSRVPRWVQLGFCEFLLRPLCTPKDGREVAKSRGARTRCKTCEKRSAKRKIKVTTSGAKRRHSSGNRILWTSGQWTEVHKIRVTTWAIFPYACTSWRGCCCLVLPGWSSCVFVGFSCALNVPPKGARATFKTLQVHRRCPKHTANRSVKTKSASSQMHQRAGAQVVT